MLPDSPGSMTRTSECTPRAIRVHAAHSPQASFPPNIRRQKPGFLTAGGDGGDGWTVPSLSGGTGGATPVVGTDCGIGSVAASARIPPGWSGQIVVGCVPLTK